MAIYIFDGSLEGLLTAIFERYERKHQQVALMEQRYFQPVAFEETLEIFPDEQKALRVWKGLAGKLSPEWMKRFYAASLSELPEAYQHLFDLAIYVFDSPGDVTTNYGNAHVLAIAQIDRKVHRERHRMEAFIRFRKTGNGVFIAEVEPDFNVLPLILKHFRNRYADQQWIIYDLRRQYGIWYDLEQVHEITLDAVAEIEQESKDVLHPALDGQEALFAALWKDYFTSTNIKERKNMKLHIRHVPRRYWKYLTEKQDIFSGL